MSWLDTVCGWCEAGSKATLNVVSCGNQWGDQFYGAMDTQAQTYMNGVAAQTHEEALKQAIANGASKMQAEIAANQAVGAKMDGIIDPQSMSDVGDLLGSGIVIGGNTVTGGASSSASLLGTLAPALIAVGALGGVYMIADYIGRPSAGNRACAA